MGVIHTLRGMSVNESEPITAEAVQRRLKAVDVDLRCALAFSRALLRGMAAVSSQARHALDAALHEELGVIANDDSECTAAALHIVSEARADLHRDSGFQSLLALDLERAIIEKAAEVGRLVVENELDPERRLRSCG